MIERSLFKPLLQYLSVFPVVGLIGPRNAGKTTLAKNAMKWFARESVYLDLEFGPEFNKLQVPKEYIEENDQKCIVLDEVHRKTEVFAAIRDQLDLHEKSGSFLIITSLGNEILRNVAELLSGNIGYIFLTPLNRLELSDEHDRDAHWLRGGFPDSFLTPDDKTSFKWRDNLIRTYCERDLPQMGMVVDPEVIRRFLTMLATDQGDIWNASDYARSMGLSSPTVTRYLKFLDEAYLITILRPFLIETKKRLVKAPKIYLSDSGVLHALLQIDTMDELRGHIIVGSSWEGYVLGQIQSLVSRKAELFHYATHQGAKIDLVLAQNGKPKVSIEIQTTNKPNLSKGFRTAIADLKTELNYLVTPSSASYRLTKNVYVMGVDELLQELMDKLVHRRGVMH